MSSPATAPDVTVAVKGVLVRGLTLAKHLKSRPSSAMAQITLGIGNMEPSKLVREKEKKACRASECTQLQNITGDCCHKGGSTLPLKILFAVALRFTLTKGHKP